jgi:hypothetical protein
VSAIANPPIIIACQSGIGARSVKKGRDGGGAEGTDPPLSLTVETGWSGLFGWFAWLVIKTISQDFDKQGWWRLGVARP